MMHVGSVLRCYARCETMVLEDEVEGTGSRLRGRSSSSRMRRARAKCCYSSRVGTGMRQVPIARVLSRDDEDEDGFLEFHQCFDLPWPRGGASARCEAPLGLYLLDFQNIPFMPDVLG